MSQLGLQLDAMYGSFLSKAHEALNIDLGESLTIVANNEDAFALNSPNGKITRPVLKKISTGSQVVCRAVIPYSICSQIAQDYITGIYILSLYKNAMLKEVAENFNVDTAKVKPTFALPGRNGAYFREIDSAPGLEIRLFASN